MNFRKRPAAIFGGISLLVGLALCSPPPKAGADISPFTASGNLQAAATSSTCTATNTNVTGALGACVQVQCPQGESSAVVNVANTASITGTVTVYTATDINGTAGTYGAPLWSTAAGGTTNVSTITNSGKLYVTLGSDMWVEAVFTTASSGHGTATVTCSGAVARVGNLAIPTALPTGQTGFSNLVCSGNVVCSPSAGPTPAVTETNSPTFTGQVAAGGFGASPTGAWNGSCTGSTGASTCTATIGTTFAAPLCFANDTNQTPGTSIRVVCSVSGTTVTVQTLQQLLTGSCPMVSATTCTAGATYRLASSTCWAQSTTAQILEAAICALATTTVTITANASNSLTWNYFVIGAPEVAHTYQFVVFGNPN